MTKDRTDTSPQESEQDDLLLDMGDAVTGDGIKSASDPQTPDKQPSMDEILDNIRNIISEDKAQSSSSGGDDWFKSSGNGQRSEGVSAAKYLSIIVVFGAMLLMACAFVFSREISANYPFMRDLYAAIGMDEQILGAGLELSDYKISKHRDQAGTVLLVSGTVRNVTGNELEVPILRGLINDQNGMVLYFWSFRANTPRVAAGKSVFYETAVRNPSRDGATVSITFVSQADFASEAEMAQDRKVGRQIADP